MKDLVEFVAKSLVAKSDEVEVIEKQNGNESIISLKVAKEDMGKVIGKKGKIAKALRTVVNAAASRNNQKVIVDIVDK
ncbi:KH domain-containing protein [Proteinivorax hydrogeniformans]|uniref:RNA-binding protein KhpA n=1 Tax=Proteinivorax hydrogeniformans TaxID=1826727 RepID=A0AAU8HPC4_9FIRM